MAFDPSKRESPKSKRRDPIQPGNHGWLASESNPEFALKFARDQKYVHTQLPWERSAATDRLFYEEITNQIFEVIIEAGFQNSKTSYSISVLGYVDVEDEMCWCHQHQNQSPILLSPLINNDKIALAFMHLFENGSCPLVFILKIMRRMLSSATYTILPGSLLRKEVNEYAFNLSAS